MIFAEHEKLINEVPLLESKITNLKIINSNWQQIDSLRSIQITEYQKELQVQEKNIVTLQKSLKVTGYVAGGGIIATVIATLICVLK